MHRMRTASLPTLDFMTSSNNAPQSPRPDDWAWHPTQPQPTMGHTPGGSFGHYPNQNDAYTAQVPAGAPGTATLTAPAPGPAKATRRSRAAMFVASTAIAAVVGAGAGVGGYAFVASQYGGTAASSGVTAVPVAQPATLDGTITAAAEKISPSVVTITVRSGQGGGIGSGVVLDTEGHILTNDHVVSESSGTGAAPTSAGAGGQSASITVTFEDGSTAPATVVGTSEKNDLAVIKVTGAKADLLKPATFAESSSVIVGQSVVAVGAPLGLSETVTSGIVSATARPVRSGTSGNAVYQAVQTDAAINPGNSGGALVNLNGQVIGINAAGAALSSNSGSATGNIGLGFAIPADVAVRVSNDLIANGTAADAVLGVSLQAGDSAADTTSEGVTLGQLTSSGPAAKAGLRSGDVVTAVDSTNTTTADGLIAAIRFHAPGSTVTIHYLRDNQAATAQVTLGSA